MTYQNRLSDLLHDPGWSLPTWPQEQALARIRRAARRQRLVAATLSASAAVVVAAIVAVPFTLPRLAQSPRPVPSPRLAPSPVVPAVGSAGFPANIYPAAITPHGTASGLGACPAPTGLQPAGLATPAAALAVLHHLDSGLAHQLRLTDRSAWLLLTASGRRAATMRALRSGLTLPYSGPLRAGVGELAAVRRAVTVACGRRVMRSTWVIVSLLRGRPSGDAELLFLTRRGHLLWYGMQ